MVLLKSQFKKFSFLYKYSKKIFNKNMKPFQLILILSILVACFNQEDDECSIRFEEILSEKCLSIDSTKCRLTDNSSNRCLQKNTCSSVTSGQTDCEKLIPENFHQKKCAWTPSGDSGTCGETDKKCSDFNKGVNSIAIDGDVCSSLKTVEGTGNEVDNGNRCLLTSATECKGHFNTCTGITDSTKWIDNIPSEANKICRWDGSNCQIDERYCEEYFYNIGSNVCPTLKKRNTGTQCIYSGSRCVEVSITCAGYYNNANPETSCNGNTPLIENGNDYDYKYICSYDSTGTNAEEKCKKRLRTCDEYTGTDENTCIGLKATDSNKRCVYDEGETSTHKCKEEYKTCELYSEYKLDKTRTGCEDLILLEENDKCVFDIEEDKCMTRINYTTCEEYEGNEKKICESIQLTTYSKCVLDKDLKCKERAFLCSEVFDEENCLYYAKASISNKRCAYDSSRPDPCYEEYIKCEDYIGNDSTICNEIKLYDGKKCVLESDRCRTKNKTCSEVSTKEECKMIALSGSSNPDKRVCDFFEEYDASGAPTDSYCMETFKYCSDYRGTNATFCVNYIKPYNETENKIDITSKCKYESGIGCQRVPKECSEADGNPVLCALISPKIQDNKIKYCAYIGDDCEEHYKKCENYEKTSTSADSTKAGECSAIVPENYLTGICEYKLDSTDNIYKCVTKTECTSFSPADYENLCYQISPNCSYSSDDNTCTKKENPCSNIDFYKANDDNEESCKNMEASVPYKVCSLKEDKSGCEEILKEEYYSSSPSSRASTQQNSDKFMTIGIHLILIILCL